MTGPPVAAATATLMLAAEPTAPGTARRFLADTLHGRVPDSTLDVAQLLGSELVTNAVVHAASEVVLEVELDDLGLLVRVRDADTGPLVSRSGGASELDEGGRGFMLVDRLAHTWGTEHSGGRKAVWFRLVHDGTPPSLPTTGTGKIATEPPVTRARRLLNTLVLRPDIRATLTLREQIRELLARTVDAVGAQGGSVQLAGETSAIVTGKPGDGTTTCAVELVVDDRHLGQVTVALDEALADDDDAFLRHAADRLALLAA